MHHTSMCSQQKIDQVRLEFYHIWLNLCHFFIPSGGYYFNSHCLMPIAPYLSIIELLDIVLL